MEGLSPMTVAKPLAHEPTVLTCIEYSVKNRPGSRLTQQQSCDRVHGTGSLVGAAKQSAVTRVEAVQEDEQRHERGKRRHRDQNGPLRAGRHETHQIAGVGLEEVQVAWQNRLVSYRHLEMLNHGDDERHRQKYRRGHPETVGEHEQ